MQVPPLHPRQLLLVGRANVHFLVRQIHRERAESEPIFVFGRTLGIGHFAPYNWAETKPKQFRDRVLEWTDQEAKLLAWTRTYSKIAPLGIERWTGLDVCWPIQPELFQAAQEALWDMTRSDAPIDWLQEVIDEISSHYPH